jgi:hypothetical protein
MAEFLVDLRPIQAPYQFFLVRAESPKISEKISPLPFAAGVIGNRAERPLPQDVVVRQQR